MSGKISLKTKIKFSKEINNLLILGDGRICISYDNNIAILNKITFKLEITALNVHKKEINSLSQLEDGKLISCANEPILNIYNIEEKSLPIYQKIKIFSNIPKELTKTKKYLFKAAELINKDLAICGTCPVLNFYKYNSLKDLFDFNYYIHNKTDENIKNFIQINENQIILVIYKYCGFFPNTGIKLCNLEKKEIKEKSINGFTGKFVGESICKISENYLAIGVNNLISIIDLKILQRIKKYYINEFRNEYCWNLCVFNNYLFCGSESGRIYKYIINEDKLEFKEQIEQDISNPIKSLIKINNKTMVFTQKENIFINNFNENN